MAIDGGMEVQGGGVEGVRRRLSVREDGGPEMVALHAGSIRYHCSKR